MPDTYINIESIERLVLTAGWQRVGIDGVDGSGKSYLADKLSQALAFPALALDDYLHKNQGGYADFIDYPALSAALSSMPAFILSGVCLREVLSNMALDLDGHIYVKRMHGDLWVDEDDCVFPEGVEVAIENLASNTAMISRNLDEPSEQFGVDRDEAGLQLTFEVMHYHDAFCPQDTADLVYERGYPEPRR
jgi:hypothetical protein